jgi:hypothetical protein
MRADDLRSLADWADDLAEAYETPIDCQPGIRYMAKKLRERAIGGSHASHAG